MHVKKLCEDDKLLMPEVRIWAKNKYEKIGYYADLFASSMKRKWDCRVYLDLFSCAAKVGLRITEK